MTLRKNDVTAMAISAAVHVAVAALLLLIQFQAQLDDFKLSIESIFSEERSAEEFTRDLNQNTQTSETLSIVEGQVGAAGSAVGGAAAVAAAQARIDNSQQFEDPVVALHTGDIALPGLDSLGTDLGEAAIKGEPQAVAEGYGPALSRIAQELIRMMREEKLLVAWLFDESESMRDDQGEIREQFHKVYEEIGLALERDTKIRGDKEILLTAVHGFGKEVSAITPKPTSDLREIRSAIDKIKVDETGIENIFNAVNKVVDQYRSIAARGRRRLVLVLVTDESGDDGDGDLLDEVVRKCQKARAPVYILGRESLFGYKYGRMRWQDPKYGLTHWLGINRGPETAFAEALQFDGLHDRWDSHPSGFAPYEQARLAKETGGIFFILPHEEENLVGQADIDKRKFAFLDMKEYTPELVVRRRYLETRSQSRFRTAVADVVRLLDPRADTQLNIADWGYSTERSAFRAAGQANFERGLRALGLLNQAAGMLDKVGPLRDKETSQRWRANYDLALAQILAYRVRLFQFLLAMDGYLNDLPAPKNPQNNVWNVARVQEMLEPTERQIKLTKVDLDELRKQHRRAKELFEFVIKTHPRTPWANRAQFELMQGFGIRLVEGFRDPRYDRVVNEIKFPTL